MNQLAVSVIGTDRPGIIAAITEVLAELGGNLEDSSMTILRGHFAMTLIVTTQASEAEVDAALAPVASALGVVATVAAVAPEPQHEAFGAPYVLSVHGADRPWIVARVMRVVAERAGNVTDLTTRLGGGLYVLVADVELPASVAVDELRTELERTAGELGVEVTLRAADIDVL